MNKYHNVESLDFDENTLTIVLQGTHQRVSKHIRDPFIAEQAVVLPEEKTRLKALPDTLEKIAGRSFLVVGHAARV